MPKNNKLRDDNEAYDEKQFSLIRLEIIKEIFGANYHSQIISKSNKIWGAFAPVELKLNNKDIEKDKNFKSKID